MAVTLALLAPLIEAIVGYPDRLVRAIGHPVTWMGRLISILDRTLNHESMSNASRQAAGAVAILIIIGIPTAIGYVLERSLQVLPLSIARWSATEYHSCCHGSRPGSSRETCRERRRA